LPSGGRITEHPSNVSMTDFSNNWTRTWRVLNFGTILSVTIA
jgi:hypothetical protein